MDMSYGGKKQGNNFKETVLLLMMIDMPEKETVGGRWSREEILLFL